MMITNNTSYDPLSNTDTVQGNDVALDNNKDVIVDPPSGTGDSNQVPRQPRLYSTNASIGRYRCKNSGGRLGASTSYEFRGASNYANERRSSRGRSRQTVAPRGCSRRDRDFGESGTYVGRKYQDSMNRDNDVGLYSYSSTKHSTSDATSGIKSSDYSVKLNLSTEDTRISKLMRRLSMERDSDISLAVSRKLLEVLLMPDNAAYIRKSYCILHESMLDILKVSPGTVAKEQCARALGRMGYVMGKEGAFDKFLHFVMLKIQSDMGWLFMLAIKETLVLERTKPVLHGIASRLMKDLVDILESTDNVDLFKPSLDNLINIVDLYPDDFYTFFRDTTDLLLGWHVDISQPMCIIEFVSISLQRLHKHFKMNMQLSVTLILHFIDDIEGYSIDMQNKDGRQTVEHLTLSIMALNTVLKCLGDNFAPGISESVTVKVITDCILQIITTISIGVEGFVPTNLIIAGNESISLMLPSLTTKTSGMNTALLNLIDLHLSIIDEYSNSAVISTLLMIAKVIKELSANLPIELIPKLLGPDSELIKLRSTPFHSIQEAIICIYQALLNLKNIPLLQEAYRYILGDLEQVYRIVVPSVGNLTNGNPFTEAQCNFQDAEITALYLLRCLCQLANASGSIIGMWALKPSILELLGVHLLPSDEYLAGKFPALHYSLLYLIYSHCKCYNYFISSSTLVSMESQQKLQIGKLEDVSRKSPNSANFAIILDILYKSCKIQTSIESRLLLLQWFQDIISNVEPYLEVLHITKEFYQVAELQISCGYLKNNCVILSVATNLELLLSKKWLSWNNQFLRDVIDLCVLHITSVKPEIRSKYTELSSFVPWDVAIAQFATIGEREDKQTTSNMLAQYNRTNVIFAQQLHLNGSLFGEMYPFQFKAFMQYLLKDGLLAENNLEDLFLCCWPIEAEDNQEHIVNERYKQLALLSSPIINNWCTWEAAQFCVNTKLRTPLGKPNETFTSFEKVLKQLAKHVMKIKQDETIEACGNVDKIRVRLLLQFMENLEMSIYNAMEGCAVALIQVNKPVRTFFSTNSQTCKDWLSRIRIIVIQLALHAGLSAIALRHGQELLFDLSQNNKTNSVDFERAAMYTALALLSLHETEALYGLHAWCINISSMNFGWLKHTAEQAGKRFEAAAIGYRNIMAEAHIAMNLTKCEQVPDIHVRYFISDQIINCHKELNNWIDVINWKNDELYSEMVETENGMRYSLNTVDFDCAQHLFNLEAQNYAFNALTAWEENEPTKSWSSYDVLSNVETQLYHIALNIPLQKNLEIEKKINHALKVINQEIQHSLVQVPSDFLQQFNFLCYVANGLKEMLHDVPASTIFLVSESFEDDVGKIDSSFLRKILWWSEYFCKVQEQPSSIFCSNLRLNIINKARKERNFNLASSHLYRFLKNKDLLESMHNAQNTLLATIGDSFLNKIADIPHWNFDTAKSVQELVKLLYENNDRQLAFNLCATASTAITKCADIYGGTDLKEISSRILLKLAGWLQLNEQVSITELNSPLAKLLMVLPEIAPIDNCVNTAIPLQDMVIGKLLKFSVQQCVGLAKSWNIFGTWCYRWGRKIVDSSTDMSTVLSEEDKACIMTSLPLNVTQEDIKRVSTILAQTRSNTDEEDIDSNEINTSEKILSQLKAISILEACQDHHLEDLVNIWRKVQKRVYAYYELSAEAYFKYLELATNSTNMSITTESNSVTVTLRLLRLIVKHALELQTVLESGLATTPTHPWKVIIPQLFSRLTHPESYVRQRVSELLCRIAKDAPHLITFPAVVGALEGGVKFDFSEISMPKDSLSQNEVPIEDEIEADFDSDIDENKNLLQDCFKSMVDTLSTQAPETITQVQLLVKELRRIILLWDELWLGTLAQHQSDISRRQMQLTGEVKKVKDNTYLNEEEKVSLINEKHRIIFKPIIFILEQLNEITSAEPETPHERYFQEKYSKQIDELLVKLKNPDNPERPEESWKLLRHLQSQFQHRAHKRSLLNMQDISPILAAVKDTVISMPGQFSSTTVTIAKVSSKVAILPTKTKPKKLIFYGSDGLKYTYLFKGLEDLHLDERIMQFLSIANTMMAHSSSKETNAHQYQDLYSARHYSVIPLGPRSGLISWVDGTTPAFAMYKRWQQRGALKQQKQPQQNNSTILRPSELFYNKLNPLLTKHGVKNMDNRKEWPFGVLKQVLNELVAETPANLLSKELWCHSVDTASWWRKIRKYSYSVAVMSIIGYIIGLGDRHLDNVLVDLNTGEVVHIDYNVCFEKGKTLCVPEKVPFRLTQNIRDALGVTGVEGIFRIACEQVLKTMKKGRETLLTLLEAFVYDPLVDWTVGNEGLVGTSFGEGRALNKQHRKDIEKEVTLAMYNVRCTEMKKVLKENGIALFNILPTLTSQLQTVIESHIESHRLDDTLQDLHQQMAFVKEAEANPQTKNALASLPSRFAEQLKTQNLYNTVQHNLEKIKTRCEKCKNDYDHSIQKIVDEEFSEQLKDVTTVGDVDSILAEGVENFLQNAGQVALITQCNESEKEIIQLLERQSNLVKNCFGQLQEYHNMLAPCTRSYIDKHRVHTIAKLSSFLHSTQDIDYFDQVFKEFKLFRDDPIITHHSKHILKYAINLFVVYNEVSAQIAALFEELQAVSNANVTCQTEKAYADAKTELNRFLQRESGASEALEFVLVAVLIVLNKNFLMLETAAAKTGDWLLRLTSRDGDWFLDDLIMSCNKAVELVSYVAMPANGVTDLTFGQLMNGLQVANTMYRSLYEMNLNFHTIILPETIREVQSENPSVLQMIHDLNRLINSMDCPITETIVHLEKHYNCLVMEMENASYSYIQVRLLDLKAQYNAMINNNQPLTPGQMLLMGFNGLFEKLDIESANLCNALGNIDVPISWRKVDQIKEAKSISATIWIYNAEINRILDDIFFLKRLQTMDEFFSLCLQIGQWSKTADFSENMFKDERLIQSVRKYIADYISRRFLGVTTETIAYIICHLLQKLGLNLEDEIEQKDIGAEHKVPLDELYHKGWNLVTKRSTFTQNTFSQASTLENNLRTAWEKLQEPKKLEQTLRILRSSCLRIRTQLNTHSWMYEDVIIQHPLFQNSPIFLKSRFFKSFESDAAELDAVQQKIGESKEKQTALIACVEQRLKWAAGSSPDEIKPLLAAFTQRCQSNQLNTAPIKALIAASNAIVMHEKFRGHHTPESRSLDQLFITHFDQWRQACQNKRELVAMLSGDDGSGGISDIERTLMGYYTPEMVGNQMWMQILDERIGVEIATVQIQIETHLETILINEMEFRKTIEEMKIIHRQLCSIVAEFKVVLKNMVKIEEYTQQTQIFMNTYQQLSENFHPLLHHLQLDQSATDILAHLNDISQQSPAIYASLLTLDNPDTHKTLAINQMEQQQICGNNKAATGMLLVRQGAIEENGRGNMVKVVKQESREQQRNAYAVGVWRRVRLKLEGRDPDPGRRLTVQEQVDYVIREASSVDNLASLYEGWTPWV